MEFGIRATASVVTQKLSLETTASRKRLFTRASKKLKRKSVRNSLLAVNLLVFFVVFAFVLHHTSSAAAGSIAEEAAVNGTSSTAATNPLDQLSSTDIAVQVARMTGIYEATSVNNLADSQDATTNIVASDNQVIAKPTIMATDNAKSRYDIVTYTARPGDTVSALSQKYGVTSNSIQWSNNLTSNNIAPGATLTIPPVNGIVYTVKAGDTPTSIAQQYNAQASQIIAFNDAEISGIQPGEKIVIPDAVQPATTLASSSGAGSSSGYGSNYSFGYGPVYGENGYDYGYCTWYVAEQRAALGIPVPANLGNASTWYPLAQEAGIPTGSAPQPNAVLWFGYSANHVAIVKSVNADGSITIGEMNRNGWDVADTRVIPASQAASYKYIY